MSGDVPVRYKLSRQKSKHKKLVSFLKYYIFLFVFSQDIVSKSKPPKYGHFKNISRENSKLIKKLVCLKSYTLCESPEI